MDIVTSTQTYFCAGISSAIWISISLDSTRLDTLLFQCSKYIRMDAQGLQFSEGHACSPSQYVCMHRADPKSPSHCIPCARTFRFPEITDALQSSNKEEHGSMSMKLVDFAWYRESLSASYVRQQTRGHALARHADLGRESVPSKCTQF